jgi:CBS domain-containing protein
MKVSEVMHSGVNWVTPNAKLTEIAKIMRENDIGAVPVGEDDRLIGMVTDRDIAIRGFGEGLHPESLTARDVMTKEIVFCRSDDSIEDAIRLMEIKKIRRLPVISKQKRMVGMLSIGDLSHRAGRELTGELVGAISGHHA